MKDPRLTKEQYEALKPEASEDYSRTPAKVVPGNFNAAPSDAVILFDGKDLSSWHKPKYGYGGRMDQVEDILNKRLTIQEHTEAAWTVKDNMLIVKPGTGAIETKQSFGSCQMHIEWLAPQVEGKKSQGYSNSGLFFMGLYEIQILNSYENETYPNGQAGSMYKQHIPLVNSSKPPGEWQSYDIVFNAPKFDAEGNVTRPATITAFHNGVLIQNEAELKGPCIYIGQPFYIPHPDKMPIILQDHGDLVRFRNIWIREL